MWAGIDNFAKPTDDLGRAARNKTTGRNFSGSSPGRADNIIGLGPTSTNAFGRYYFQSLYELPQYTEAVNAGRFPVFKGYRLSDDERLRRDVIFRIQCRQEVDIGAVEREHGIDFHYVTANSEVLGWVIENITGTPIAELIGARIFEHLGAERDAFYITDRLGKAVAGGGGRGRGGRLRAEGVGLAEGEGQLEAEGDDAGGGCGDQPADQWSASSRAEVMRSTTT